MDRAARVAVVETAAFLATSPYPGKVVLVCFGQTAFEVFRKALAAAG
jgi:O-acetyl-ADP-ribose deacetylase (regulator of RNase III)